MRTNHKFFLTGVLLSLSILSLDAQNGEYGAYFNEGYNFRHEMNPAFTPSKSYVNIASFNLEARTNFGLDHLLYEDQDGNLAFGLEGNEDRFINGFRQSNKIGASAIIRPLSAGFFTKNDNFYSIDIKSKSCANLTFPIEFVNYIADMEEDQVMYKASGINMNASSYAEVALGHSRKINDRLRVGLKLKYMMGLAEAGMNINSIQVDASNPESVSIIAEGDAEFRGAELNISTGEGEQLDFNSISIDPMDMLKNFGAAIDLGATYKINDLVTVSASLLDLGAISWKGTAFAKLTGDEVIINSYECEDEEGDFDITGALNNLGFSADNITGRKIAGIPATINAGAEVIMPFWDRMSVGAVVSHRFGGTPGSWLFDASANFAFTQRVSASLDYGFSDIANRLGCFLNFQSKVTGTFLGCNFLTGPFGPKHTVQFSESRSVGLKLPTEKIHLAMTFGLSITFGRYHGRIQKKDKDA